MESKHYLIKLRNGANDELTLCTDGYVYNNHVKLFILKKLAMQEIINFINELEESEIAREKDFRCTIKCNGNTRFVSHNNDLFNKLVRMIFKSGNIKHPPLLLDEVISLIEELRATGELDTRLQANPQDVVIDELISTCKLSNQ